MAQKDAKIFLGYADEYILDKHKPVVNYTTNKIGGLPDWPIHIDSKITNCPLCELPRPLILQIYAPLDNSSYHRTLYLFACINPNCCNQNESWVCLRSQILEQSTETEQLSTTLNNSLTVTDWCQDADDWDDNNANLNEENGNLISPTNDHPSDDEDESYSFEEMIRGGLEHLTVDEKNANFGAVYADVQGGGAVGRQNSPTATAEIEGDESEVVTIDTPIAPQHDIAALLHEITPLPQQICQRTQIDSKNLIQFQSIFVSASEETHIDTWQISDHHVRNLMQNYQQNNDDSDVLNVGAAGGAADSDGIEKYERSVPIHGDKMFHHFLTKIYMNPGQILRYSRGGTTPLVLYPLQDLPQKCKYCQSDLLFELQVLPTLISLLRLQGIEDNKGSRVEFGTVLIFTCSRSCWSSDSKLREEVVIVQSEKY